MKNFTTLAALSLFLYSVCAVAQGSGGTTHSNSGTGPCIMRQMSVYPNPSVDEVNILLDEENELVIKNDIMIVHYSIVNEKGIEVVSREVEPTLYQNINVSDLPTGNYYIYIKINQSITDIDNKENDNKEKDYKEDNGWNTIVKHIIKK